MAKGLATSRQIIQSHQRLTDHSVGRLIVNDPGAPSTKHLMFKLRAHAAEKGPVQYRRAAMSFRRGSMIIWEDERFYLVESDKYPGWYYCMIQRNGEWLSSAGKATKAYIAKVEAMQAAPAPVPADVMEKTVALTAENSARGSVQYHQAKVDFTCGDLAIERRDWIYLVESDCAGRFYAMVWRQDAWRCSDKDYRTNIRCAEKIEEFQQQLKAA